jgi:hypothetical protein
MDPTPQSAAIARRQAAAQLAPAKRDCRMERDCEVRKSCMADVRDDYEHMMVMSGSGSREPHMVSRPAL